MNILKMKTKDEKPEEQEVWKWADILNEIIWNIIILNELSVAG